MNSPAEQSNRLIHETSPYLLQHAHNPVDWFPWGVEAFAEARQRDLPVFLSVGYSACHWCHVMERESFENPQIAELMNRWFINVKVDREERPDVDQIYMTAVQLVTGHGGWPMSVFMTPDGQPFYGGTYWPPTARQGMIGFADLLNKIHEFWDKHRDECLSKGREMVKAIDQLQQEQQVKSELHENLLKNAGEKLLKAADWQEGGFGSAPKFPHSIDLRLLLRYGKRFGNDQANQFVSLTLDKMFRGGIYDHLAGGFARYSTDREWLVPHFEKMLYDNALLIPAYLEASQFNGCNSAESDPFLDVVQQTLNFIIKDMTSDEGGFYSTYDADSEGEEGKYYVWSANEIQEILGNDAELFQSVFDVSTQGNWEGKNILNRSQSLSEINQTDQNALQESCRKLLQHREAHRVPPARDEKIILAWNGLMITAFARSYGQLLHQQYLTTACEAADFILSAMRDEQGQLWHSYKDGRCSTKAFLDDYACLIEGLTDLSLVSGNENYLQAALELAEMMIDQFYDEQSHAFHYTARDHEQLIVRLRDHYDNAIPSGTNLAIHALLKLGQLLDRNELTDIAVSALDAVSGTMLHQPSGMCQALLALDRYLSSQEEFICVASDLQETRILMQLVCSRFLPNATLVFVSSDQSEWKLLQEKLQGKLMIDEQPTVYKCEQGRCDQPWVGREEISRQLELLTKPD